MLKGVAILMMLFLHLFAHADIADYCQPLIFIGGLPLANIIARACSPVGIFLMLSGYGLHYVYRHGSLGFRPQGRRLLKLYIHYWIILLIFVGIGHIVRPTDYPGSAEKFVLNMLSIRNSYNAEHWFLFPYMLLSVTAYCVFKVMDRLGNVWSLIITMFLYLVSCFIISRYVAPAKAYTAWYNIPLTYFDLLFSFVIGAVMQRKAEDGGLRSSWLLNHKAVIWLALCLWLVTNCLFTTQAFNPLYEVALIWLLLHLNIIGWCRRVLASFGKHSMVMWLTHTFFCYYLFHDFIYGFRYPIVIYLVLIAISYAVSFPIMAIAKQVIKKARI